MLVENQSVEDIIDGIKNKHFECYREYDEIAEQFYGGDLYDVCERLWNFCRSNFKYDIEGIDKQYVSAPQTMLTRGHNDCKGYALFIGGVLDAMKRQGENITWVYRFASYKLFRSTPQHVFIVVNPSKENIWIDPVLDRFNEHYPYFTHQDLRIVTPHKKERSIGRIDCPSCIGRIGRSIGAVAAASSFYFAQNGAVWANDNSVRSNGLTANEMGLPFAMQVLARGYDQKHPGTAAAWWANPPVIFTYNGEQVGLPNPNTKVGGAVPLLPLGLTVEYAPSFMGIPIPEDMIKPVVVPGTPGGQNRLQLSPQDIPGYPGGATNSELSANDSFLLIVLEAALGPLINAYSAYPYASNFGSTNNLDNKCFHERGSQDLLVPDPSKTVLQSVAPIAGEILSYVVPGIGSEVNTLIKAAVPQNAPIGPAVVNPATVPISSGGSVFSNPWLLLTLAVGGFLIINSLDNG